MHVKKATVTGNVCTCFLFFVRGLFKDVDSGLWGKK